jgi:curli biogenesis system outer membrane secretion channel CsgG
MRFFSSIRHSAHYGTLAALSLLLAGCATVSATPQPVQPPKAAAAINAIYAEPTAPTVIEVRDFDFAVNAVTENRSPLHRGIDLVRRSSADQREDVIGQEAAMALSKQTAKKLDKAGLQAVRVPRDSDISLQGNFLLVTGRLVEVDEGNRFTRVAVGLGAGQSRLATVVRVYRVTNGERAEVLKFTTHADSGKMPGMLASVGAGELFVGPITLLSGLEDALSSGQKIYVSQIEYLADETGNEVAAYLTQYSAAQGWIPLSKAARVHYAS